MKRRYWTRSEEAMLRERYADSHTPHLAAELGRDIKSVYAKASQMGLHKSPAYLASPEAGRLRKGDGRGGRTRFNAGHAPWNKGTHWAAGGRSVETRFRKGQWPVNKDPGFYVLGALRWSADGYLEMRVSFDVGSKGWRGMHVILWEDAHGPLPKGCAVRFKDCRQGRAAITARRSDPRIIQRGRMVNDKPAAAPARDALVDRLEAEADLEEMRDSRAPSPQPSARAALLREAAAALAQRDVPRAEPIGWHTPHGTSHQIIHWGAQQPAYGSGWAPLYAAPQERSDAQRDDDARLLDAVATGKVVIVSGATDETWKVRHVEANGLDWNNWHIGPLREAIRAAMQEER